jgi:hypothetical protein
MSGQGLRLTYRNSRTASIDRLGWSCAFVAHSYGVRVGLRADDEALLTEMRELLPPGATADDSAAPVERIFSIRRGDGLYHLYTSGRRLVSTQTKEEILEWFEAKCRLYIAEHSPSWVFVHAGVVVWRGQLLVIPGHSLSGKTTLVRALLQNGAVYYSDEYAVFDVEGEVYPFATPLGIRREGALAQTKQEASVFGAETGYAPRRLDWVILTRYRKGSTKPLREVSAGTAVLGLLAHTVSARRFPQRALLVLKKAVRGAKIRKGYRGEAQEMLNYLLP